VFGNVFEGLKVLAALAVGGGDCVEEFACQSIAGFIDDCFKDFGLEGLSEVRLYFSIEVALFALERVEDR
jgi:hypothetical protein